MGGFEDHIAIMGDWMAPSPSPRSFFSSMINDEALAKSIADSGSENRSGPIFPGFDGQGASGNTIQKQQILVSLEGDQAINSNALVETRGSNRGGLLERIAARAGFNAPRLNTESIKPADLSKNPGAQSPLTIPPGLSPTTLLDSPQLLSNSLVMPSPTTGKFSFASLGNAWNSTFLSDVPDKGKENAFEDMNTSSSSSFAFKPVQESSSFPYFNAANKSFPSTGVSSDHSDASLLHQNGEPLKHHPQNDIVQFQQANLSKPFAETNRGGSNLPSEQTYNPVSAPAHSSPLDEPPEEDGDQRSSGDPNAGGSPGEDGYNWRKYGQKQVKGSEYPRSYYKCTHPNCPVKKKVERSHEGHITEIIYKGAHNHPKPPPNRRASLGSSNALSEMQLDPEQPGSGANGDAIWSGTHRGNADWRQENLEATTPGPLGQEYMNAAAPVQAPTGAQSGDAVDGSSTFSNDDEEDRVTHGSVSQGYEAEGDESESKRRKIETYASEISGATRAIREPRVVVQTTSEVDILDDGYRWRKYGQKVVKGNPNPRSYYKCTSAGCNVRKHVERASHDLKSVITTYEGKHNHDVPAARNSSHLNSGSSSALAAQQAPAAPPSSHILRPEPSQIHGSMAARFERPSLSSFGLPQGRPQLGPGLGFGFGMNQPGLAGLGMAGFGPNQGKLPMMPVHPYLGHHQSLPMNDMGGFMMPKGEPKLEPVTESGLNSNNASSVYQQLMSRLPLGPQM